MTLQEKDYQEKLKEARQQSSEFQRDYIEEV